MIYDMLSYGSFLYRRGVDVTKYSHLIESSTEQINQLFFMNDDISINLPVHKMYKLEISVHSLWMPVRENFLRLYEELR